jgi:hypothetical protein
MPRRIPGDLAVAVAEHESVTGAADSSDPAPSAPHAQFRTQAEAAIPTTGQAQIAVMRAPLDQSLLQSVI